MFYWRLRVPNITRFSEFSKKFTNFCTDWVKIFNEADDWVNKFEMPNKLEREKRRRQCNKKYPIPHRTSDKKRLPTILTIYKHQHLKASIYSV